MQLQLEEEIVPALPAVLRQERSRSRQVVQGRAIGRRCPGGLPGHQVQRGQLLALTSRGHEGAAAVEVTGDFEEGVLALVGLDALRQQPSDPEMRLRTRRSRYE